MIEFRAIDQWPDGWREPGRSRTSSPFRSTYDATLALLRDELDHLDASRCIVAVDVPFRDLRRDGMLRQDARVGHPGVIVTVDTPRHGTLVYATDRFVSWSSRIPSWQCNLRAVALGMEALRKVDRYGIADRGQQYAGYSALPPARPMGAAMTVEEAAEILGITVLPRDEPEARDTIRTVWRRRAAEHHPDVGGDAAMFRKMTEARDLLLGTVGG